MNNDVLICHRFIKEPATYKFVTHAHDKWEFIFVIKGNPTCMTEGKRYFIKEKTLMVFKPAQIHRVQEFVARPYEYYSLMCDESLLSPQAIEKLSSSNGIFTFKDSEEIQKKLAELERQNEGQIAPVREKLFLIEELLSDVFENMEENIELVLWSEDSLIRTAISYIDANVQDVARVDQICKAVGIKKERLYSRFIQSMLISPMKYVRTKRAALAKLEFSNEQSRNEILKQYGFKDEASFAEEYNAFCRSVP